MLRTAKELTPNDPTLDVGLGIVLRKQGHLKASVAAFESAIALDRSYAAAWFERGASFEKGGALADAVEDYRKALSLDPNNDVTHAALASVYARTGKPGPAKDHAEKARKLNPDNHMACNALAQIALEEKRFTDAIAILSPLVAQNKGEDREIMVGTFSLLGDAHEGAGQFDEAFNAYSTAQSLFQKVHGERQVEGGAGALSFIQGITESFDRADKTLWDGVAGDYKSPVQQHIFLTGYPRSGTTLVENILASLPNTVAIEERPTLSHVDRNIISHPSGVETLAALDQASLDELRREYWQRAERAAGVDLSDKLFIDMDPFKGPRLPVIAKLFPDAKIVLMRRDPRDVVWSCFHTSFAYNAGTMAFSSLESTAEHYVATLNLVQQALATIPLNVFELRYDELVQDFDPTTQALCEFLEIEWTPEVRKFDRTAQRRGVSTASVTQVRQGLYDGSGRWRSYSKQIEVVEPILRPAIEALGYTAS